MKVFNSLAGRAICLALIVLLAGLMVMYGTPGQRKAAAEGEIGTSIIITAIVELCGGFYDVGLDKLCDYLFEEDPDYQTQVDEIRQSLKDVDQEYTDVTAALNDVSTVIKQMEKYEEDVHIQRAIENITTAWYNSYEPTIWGAGANPTQQQVADFCAGVMSTYNLETDVRTIYNYMSHANEPRGVLDTYTDYLIDASTSLGATEDFSTRVKTTDGSKVVVERPMYFDYKGWTGGSNVMGAAGPGSEFYFAEGTARPGFDTYVCLQNPEDRAAKVVLTYMRGDGSTKEQNIMVPAFSRSTLRPADAIGTGDGVAFDFSTRVRSTNGVGIIAERPMYFNYKGEWTGGHDVMGAASPGKEFYFSEGTCRPGFDSYFCVQNPAGAATKVRATFMRGDGNQSDKVFDVPAHSRYTLKAEDVIGRGDGSAFDFSAKVESVDGGNIVVERPVYFDYKGWTGGHNVMGATAPQKSFYFAEGTCRPGFDPYICLQNPGNEEATVGIRYMKGDGTTLDQGVTVPARSRATVQPREVLGTGDDAAHDFSTEVRCVSGDGIVAERPMYFNYRSNWTGGHDVMGATSPRDSWYFAEGSIREGFAPYFCIQNPGNTDSKVQLTYMGTDGRETQKDVTIPAHSRKTVAAGDDVSALMTAYCGLEQYFSQLLHEQIFGADMVLEAKNFDPTAYGSPDAYLNNSLAPMIRAEVDCFRDNVQRLVLSQSTLVNDPVTNTISLGQDGQNVLNRANFICQQIKSKALNDDTSKIMGTAFATQDVIPAGQSLELRAFNKTTEQTQAATTTAVVPEYAPTMAEPFNATNWKTTGMTDFYYDQWTNSGTMPVVTFNNNLSVIWYEFNNVTPGTYYDITDSTGKVLVPNVPVYKYDDSMNVSSTGDNVLGNFTLLMRGNAGGKQMMTGWTDHTVKDTDNAWKGYDYNTQTLTPKHLSADLYSTGDAGDDREWQGYGARQFEYSGADGRQAWIMAQYTTAGDPKFEDDHGVDGLHLHQSADGDYAGAEYKITLADVTANTETTLLDTSWKLTCSSGSASKSIDDSWMNYTQPDGVNPPKMPMPVTLMNAHVYELRFYVKATGKGVGIADAYSTLDMTLNTTYIMFSN
ncbi:MAG: hypothetical protein ACYC99_01955 [Candidatus Geothermincolia bacterium]